MNGLTYYSTFEEDDKRFEENNEDFMTKTSAYRDMLAEYEAVMKEEKEREKIVQIETYIETFVGLKETGYGNMYFQKTLEDWAKFNINNRTKHDASISSGLALMACNKHRYSPVNKIKLQPVDLGIKKYDNKGATSKIIS